MAGSLSVLGPDGHSIDFPMVDLDGDGPYFSKPVSISVSNTGDTALAHLELFDSNESGHLELSNDQKTWTATLAYPDPLMPGQSKSLYARAAFSEGDEEGITEIKIAALAHSVPVELAHSTIPQSHS